MAPDHYLTVSCGFIHELLAGNYTRAAADYRGFLVTSGGDTAHAVQMERRIRDPALRTAALREASESWANFGVVIHRVLDGEDAMLGVLVRLADDPRRNEIYGPSMYTILGPRLRADPRIQAVLVRMGYPSP